MVGNQDQQNADNNADFKNVTERKNINGSDKLTKWYLVMIASIAYLALERIIEYSFGLQGMPLLADLSKYVCFAVSILVFISACMMSSWSKKRPNKRQVKAIFLFLIVTGILIVFLVFAGFQLFSPAGLSGFRERVENIADIPSTRQWISSLDLSKDKLYRIKGEDIDRNAPVFIKILKPEAVWIKEYTDEKGESLYRVINMGWTGMMVSWRLSIGPPEMGKGYIPQCDNVLQVEPGVYVYMLFK